MSTRESSINDIDADTTDKPASSMIELSEEDREALGVTASIVCRFIEQAPTKMTIALANEALAVINRLSTDPHGPDHKALSSDGPLITASDEPLANAPLPRDVSFAPRLLERSAVQQSHEDAQEIVDILTAASTDCRMSLDLRQRLTAVRERAERIARNTEVEPENSHEGRVRIPTIHLNGTSGEVLRHQYRTAVEALHRAVDATCDASPNARDYYGQGDDAGQAAQHAHVTRVASLQHVRRELEAITRGIEKQLETHRR